MNIGSRHLVDEPPYVIAEIGVNHDGSVERAVELTKAAARAGADAVKLQYFEAERLMSRASRLAAYQARAGEQDPVKMLRRLELSIQEMGQVVEAAHEAGIHAIVSIFSVELVGPALQLGWDALKVASPDLINKPLLRAMEASGRPLILSTGAASLDEVMRTIGWLHACRERLAVLQCVSSYPTPMDAAELGGIEAISSVFEGPVGYSDHTAETQTGAVAVELGAMILEKHLTHNRSAAGPDHAASLDPAGFGEYARFAREAWVRRRGWSWHRVESMRRTQLSQYPPIKRVTEAEQDVRKLSRQSLIVCNDLPAGHVLTRSDLTIKRPGTGIEPFKLESTIGRRIVRPVRSDMPLVEDDLAQSLLKADIGKAA